MNKYKVEYMYTVEVNNLETFCNSEKSSTILCKSPALPVFFWNNWMVLPLTRAFLSMSQPQYLVNRALVLWPLPSYFMSVSVCQSPCNC